MLFLLIDMTSIICAALLAVRMLASFPDRFQTQLIALILLSTICHVVLSRDDYTFWIPETLRTDVGAWRPVLNFMRNLSPGLFMVLAHRLFVDDRPFPRVLALLFAVQMLLEEPVGWLIPPDAAFSRVVEEAAPALLQVLFVICAIYWCIANWRVDLINARRQTRAVVIIVLGMKTMASSLLLRVVIDQATIASYYAHETTVALGAVVFIFILMRVSKEWLREHLALEPSPAAAASKSVPRSSGEAEIALARLRSALEDDKLYLDPELSLGKLAERLGLPEYRLRKLIHEHLGFRNFNAFLHSYRIKEACRMLEDPEQARTPILTIALSVGYQSVNTFNRGFREVVGVTPSAFRARQLGSSEPKPPPAAQSTS